MINCLKFFNVEDFSAILCGHAVYATERYMTTSILKGNTVGCLKWTEVVINRYVIHFGLQLKIHSDGVEVQQVV